MSMSPLICISAGALSIFIGHVEKAFAMPPANNMMHATNSVTVFIKSIP